MEINKRLGKKIKSLRHENGWSQEDLAEETGLHRTYISSLERGSRNPTITVLGKISGAFKITISQLTEGIN